MNPGSLVVVIGAGMAGLSAARTLERAGQQVLMLCAGTEVGGRIRTDRVRTDRGTFLLDRGFQVFLTAYSESSAMLDADELDFRAMYPGSMVRFENEFHRVPDPFRRPMDSTKLFSSPIATMTDKARLVLLDQRIRRSSLEEIWAKPETTTIEMLREAGFGDAAIERFLRPFFGGVFFDRELLTSSRMFEFVYKHFASGDTVVPAAGMGAIPQQIARGLASELRLNTPVARVDPVTAEITLGTGETLAADRVILATDANAAAQILGRKPSVRWNPTATIAYDADPEHVAQLGDSSVLVLDGNGVGPVNHLCVPSQSAPDYAPPGRALVSASIVDQQMLSGGMSDAELDAAVRTQLSGWFGACAQEWTQLGVYRIRHALPRSVPGETQGEAGVDPSRAEYALSDRVFVAGDHLTHGSTEGAVIAGRRAAEALLSG